MNRKIIAFVVLPVLGFAMQAHAFDASKVPEQKRTDLGLYLSAEEVPEFLKAHPNTLFVDIRTRAEVNFLGMPSIADANVPYAELDPIWSWDDKKSVFKLEPNQQFAVTVGKRLKEKDLSKEANIVLMCRSGDRSAKAVGLLAKQGYKSVYSVVDGYEGDMAKEGPNKGRRAVNGWRNGDLPWSYDLAKTKMSLE